MSSSSVELLEAGRTEAGRAIVGRIPEGTRRDACRALVDGDDGAAADTLATMGSERLLADLRSGLRGAVRGRAVAERPRRSSSSRARSSGRSARRRYLAEADAILAVAG